MSSIFQSVFEKGLDIEVDEFRVFGKSLLFSKINFFSDGIIGGKNFFYVDRVRYARK